MLHSQSFPLGQPSRSSGNHTVSYHIMTIAFVQMSSSLRLTGLSTRTPEEFACSHECPQPPTFCFLPSGDAPAAPSHHLRGPHTARSLCGLPVLTPDTADPPRILTALGFSLPSLKNEDTFGYSKCSPWTSVIIQELVRDADSEIQ